MERTPLLVNGRWVAARDEVAVRSPYSGEVVCRMGVADAADVDAAVAGASAALATGWPAAERAAVLDRAAAGLGGRREELARVLADEVAKPVRTGRGEVDRAVETLRFSAVEARTLTGRTIPMDAHPAGGGLVGWTRRVPLGVVAAITPFNFPLNLVAHKVGPAVAAGAPIVVKPAEQAPTCALVLAEVLLEAGLPEGNLSVLPGTGPDVGAPLAAHPGVAVVTFTGSAAVGWRLREAAPRKKVLLELGSSAPLIVEADGDVAAAAERIAVHGFSHAGQSCVSVQRVLVAAERIDELLDALVVRVEALVAGDPADEATDLSAPVNAAARDRALARIRQAVDEGAKVVTGGTAEGPVLHPTVVRDVECTLPLWDEELFAPVVSVTGFATTAEAIASANRGTPGLNAGVFTADLATAMQYVESLDYGAVLVNEAPTFRVDQMPYGGEPPAGTTREGPHDTVRELTTERLAVLRAAP